MGCEATRSTAVGDGSRAVMTMYRSGRQALFSSGRAPRQVPARRGRTATSASPSSSPASASRRIIARRRLAVALAVVLAAAVPAIGTAAVRPAAAAPGFRLPLNQPSDVLRASMPVPAADADTRGMWSAVLPWPMIAIHAVLAQNGDLVTYGTRIWNGPGTQDGHVYDTWSPATGQHTQSDAAHIDGRDGTRTNP